MHIRPRRGWLNDPNGMTRIGRRWHVFYQHNPRRAQHAAIHWGHVSSDDLVSWTEHPIAFGPQPGGPDRGGCWSGAFLPGMGRPAVAYTGIADGVERTTVCVRSAEDDRLENWSDPVVVAREPEGAGLAAMRDPFPFEWGGRRFALLGAGSTDGTPCVLLFSCDDPYAWQYEGVWLRGDDEVAARIAPADIWECPQLVRFGSTYVLVVSLWVAGDLRDVTYLVGVVEGESSSGLPRFVPASGGLLDHGPDFYAPQIIDDGSASPLLFGWIRQQDAPDEAPEDAVAGCLTLPRRLALHGTRMEVLREPALDALAARSVPLPDPGRERPAVGSSAQRVALPQLAKIQVSRGTEVSLHAGLGEDAPATDLGSDGSDCEVWVDGEVVEIFRPGTIASTIRQPGTERWYLSGQLAPGVTVQALTAPQPPSRNSVVGGDDQPEGGE